MSWTDERIEKLTKMWEGGATASQIADELGGVSRNAVIGKAHRLGLKARPSPVKANEKPARPAPQKKTKPVAETQPSAPEPKAEAPAAKPVPASRVVAKFLDLATPVLGRRHAERLVEAVEGVDGVKNIRGLTALLTPGELARKG